MNDKILNILVVLSTILAILVLFNYAYGEDVVIYRTYPGSSTPDQFAPKLVIRGDTVYQTYPGGGHSIDHLAPKLVIRDNTVYQTYPGGGYTIDHLAPKWIIEGDSYGGNKFFQRPGRQQ